MNSKTKELITLINKEIEREYDSLWASLKERDYVTADYIEEYIRVLKIRRRELIQSLKV